MKKIIGMLRPFDMSQTLIVYEDGNKIDIKECLLESFITEDIFELAKKHDIHQLDLVGPKKYAKGIANKIKEASLIKYTDNELEINII